MSQLLKPEGGSELSPLRLPPPPPLSVSALSNGSLTTILLLSLTLFVSGVLEGGERSKEAQRHPADTTPLSLNMTTSIRVCVYVYVCLFVCMYIRVVLAMYKLYWVELRQKEGDEHPSKRHRIEVMPPLRRENTVTQIANAVGGLGVALWDFLALIISLLPNLGARAVNLFALVAMVFVALYLSLFRGFGDYLVRATQMAVIGFIFPNTSAVVKEF